MKRSLRWGSAALLAPALITFGGCDADGDPDQGRDRVLRDGLVEHDEPVAAPVLAGVPEEALSTVGAEG